MKPAWMAMGTAAIEVGIFEDQHRGFAAQLQGNALQGLRTGAQNALADCGRSGE